MAKATILVIDDDEQVVNFLKENFELEGYRVIIGFDGGMAIDLAQERQPDLIIMDVNMPMTSGFDALTHLRQTPATRLIPVIFITGLESKTLYPVIDKHQRVAYMKKPIDLEHLNSLVQQFLADYPAPPPVAKTPPHLLRSQQIRS